MAKLSKRAKMIRERVESGRVYTAEEAFSLLKELSTVKFVENIDAMDYDTEPPVKPGPDGYYPVPIPGQWSET